MIDLRRGDMRDVLPTIEADSVHSVVTDPPYHLTEIPNGKGAQYARSDAERAARRTGFMGKGWDGGSIAFDPDTWRAVHRVLRPGGYLLAMGGTRTFHRLACAIEDAGFEVRDTIAWVYGSGFPKSLDIGKAIDRAAGAERKLLDVRPKNYADTPSGYSSTSGKGGVRDGGIWQASSGEIANGRVVTAPATSAARQWNGWGTALKPAMELVCVARKPLSERTVAGNVLRHGTGGINVDACRVATTPRTTHKDGDHRQRLTSKGTVGGAWGNQDADLGSSTERYEARDARWPANLVHDGSPQVEAAFAAFANGDENPVRFFANCGNDPLLYSDANAILGECKQRLVNIAKDGSSPPIASSVSVLTHAVHLASRGGATLRNCLGLGATVTVENMTLICWHVITAILNTERSASPEQRPELLSLLDSRVRIAVQWPQTDTMTITISHWKSDGSADPVTCSIMRTQTQTGEWTGGKSRFHYSSKADSADRADSSHPTVKPVELLRWMVRLVTPNGGTILDPFAGSGTTGEAAMLEGFDAILIEREAEHAADIQHRQRRWHGGDLPLFAEAAD